MNSRFFKLCQVYSNSLKMSNVGRFLWSQILEERTQVQREKEKFRRRVFKFTISIKRRIRKFHVVVVQDGKEMYQKVYHTCKVVVLHNKPIASLKFSLPLPSPSSSLKLVIGCYLGLHWTHNAIQHIKCAKKGFLSESRVVSFAHA